ncbi:MAG: alpha-2-macroglobulin family protein [Candidatus Promineifilaceae bacterium]
MSRQRVFTLYLVIVVLSLVIGCRRQEEPTPTPIPATMTAIPSPTTPPVTPTPGLIPAGETAVAPVVVGQNPPAGAEIALDGYFEVYFDQPMDENVTAAALSVVDETGAAVAGTISWPQARALRFQPTQTLKPNARYRIILSDRARSSAGESLLEGLTLEFATIGDLAVSQVSPAPDAPDAAIDSTITVIFNRPVVPLQMASAQPEMPNPLQIAPTTAGAGEWINTSVYVFRPEGPLIGRQRYDVTVSADVINAISASGAQLPADYAFSFTVAAPTYNYFALPGLTTAPGDNFTDLPLDQAFEIVFNQPMDPTSVEAAIRLTPAGGAPVPFVFDWDDEFVTVTFTPTQLLTLDTRYTLTLSDSALSSFGGRLHSGFTWRATTVPAPAVRSSIPENGQTQERFSSVFYINFASPMDRASLEGKVLFTPEITGDANGQYDRWDRSLRFYGLAASTTYTVRILPGMADPYGNVISQEQTITFTTAAYDPQANFSFPNDLALYRPGGSTAAWVEHRNVRQLDVALYRLTPKQFGDLTRGNINGLSFTPGVEAVVWQQAQPVTADLNERGYQRFDMATADGAALPPGLYFLTLDSRQVQHDLAHLQTQVVIMGTANLTLKTTATEAMVWVTDLASGQPLGNVPVVLYDRAFKEVFRGVTDDAGIVYRNDLNLSTDYGEWYYAFAEADGLFGAAISSWQEGVNPYDFGIYTDYYLRPNEPTAYVYTDRPIYRPGQVVSFKGVVRLNDDLDYSLPAFETVQVNISSYNGTVFDEAVPLSEFGSFAAQITLDQEAVLGGYGINVIAGDRYIGGGYFNVAEYRKPTFQVNVSSDPAETLAGETIAVTVDAQFFSGGAVVNGAVSWAVLATDYVFQPGGALSRFSFVNDERDSGSTFDFFYQPQEVIASGAGQTDAAGRFTVQIPAELGEETGSQSFIIEATVEDIAGNAVSGRTTAVVHQGLVYAGIRPTSYVGEAGEEFTFEVVAVDWDANPIPNQVVSVEIVERRWYSVQEENEQGETIWRTTVEEIPVASFPTVTVNASGRAEVPFTPAQGGVYRAVVTARDNQGNETVASAYAWIAGEEYVSWRRVNDHSFELVMDAGSYQPGDTAEILIASPFQGEASALVTVERGHIKQYEVLRLSGNSTIYRLPVTGDMAPNVFVTVVVIKGVDETNPTPDFKVGMAQFTVEREEQELDVQITPDRDTLGPGDTVNFTVRVSDYQEQPVEAELSLALVDLAALSLADRTDLPILDYFYATRWLSVNTALLLTRIVDAFNQELEDQIKGGGGGGGDLGVLAIRQEFPDTAYWQGQLETGPDGEATVSITLPDNLTTWRMDARAVTQETLVGEATVDIVTTRPLLVQPNTPRFFIRGDKAQLGAVVHNNTDAPLDTAVTLAAEGVTLNSSAVQNVTIPPRQQALVTWDVTVNDVDRVDLVFSARSGDLADATRPTLGTLEGQGIPVYQYEAVENAGTSGQLLDGGVAVESLALPIFPDFEVTQGEVTVEIAPSLAAAMTNGLDYLAHYPYECTEQVVSRFLPNVLTNRALQEANISDPELQANLDEQVSVGLQRLYARQLPDGGWPWWDGSRSDTLITAYVVLALIEAEASGYTVTPHVVEAGVNYLQNHMVDSDLFGDRFTYNRQAFLVYVLARAGEFRGEINQLYERRETLDLYARGYLAQAINLRDSGDARLETLKSDFISAAILSATGANWQEADRDYWNWNSDTRTTAIVLDTLAKLDPDNPLVANAVRWLMAHRTDGRWGSTQETAWTLMALTTWMSASGELEADYRYEVALNGKLLAGGVGSADTLRDAVQLQVDVSQLFQDELNRLAIARDDGPGNLYYTAHMKLWLPVEQLSPLDQGIIISRQYVDPADRETPITQITQGETFLARLTIIVPNDLHYVLIEDPLPAGVEAIDTSLKTSQQIDQPELYDVSAYDWDTLQTTGWGWWYFDHVELRDEKVVLSASYLPRGTYEYVYLVRAATPGEYRVIPPTAQEFYFPEVYGRGAGSLFVVTPR